MRRQMPKALSLLRYSVFTFTFSSELTEIKTFTSIPLAQNLHVAYVISIGSPSRFKTEIFPNLRRKHIIYIYNYIYNCAAPPVSDLAPPQHLPSKFAGTAPEYTCIWDYFLRMCELKFDMVAFVRVHGLRCSKGSTSYSVRCRAAAHCSRSQISLIT